MAGTVGKTRAHQPDVHPDQSGGQTARAIGVVLGLLAPPGFAQGGGEQVHFSLYSQGHGPRSGRVDRYDHDQPP